MILTFPVGKFSLTIVAQKPVSIKRKFQISVIFLLAVAICAAGKVANKNTHLRLAFIVNLPPLFFSYFSA